MCFPVCLRDFSRVTVMWFMHNSHSLDPHMLQQLDDDLFNADAVLSPLSTSPLDSYPFYSLSMPTSFHQPLSTEDPQRMRYSLLTAAYSRSTKSGASGARATTLSSAGAETTSTRKYRSSRPCCPSSPQTSTTSQTRASSCADR